MCGTCISSSCCKFLHLHSHDFFPGRWKHVWSQNREHILLEIVYHHHHRHFSVAWISKIIARSQLNHAMRDQLTRPERNGWKRKVFKTLSEYCERWCRHHVWWKTVQEACAGDRKSPFADGREVERHVTVYRGIVFTMRLHTHASKPCCLWIKLNLICW